MESQIEVGELEKVMKLLQDPGSRRVVREDARGALRKAGVREGAIPDRVVDGLAGLSDEEMKSIVDHNRKMLQLGLGAGSDVVAFAV